MKRTMGLAEMVRAIAEENLPRFLGDAAPQQVAGNLADIDVSDLAVIGVDVHWRGNHGRTSGWSRNDRNVLRRSTWRFAAQFSMPHRSPSKMTDSLARVTAV